MVKRRIVISWILPGTNRDPNGRREILKTDALSYCCEIAAVRLKHEGNSITSILTSQEYIKNKVERPAQVDKLLFQAEPD